MTMLETRPMCWHGLMLRLLFVEWVLRSLMLFCAELLLLVLLMCRHSVEVLSISLPYSFITMRSLASLSACTNEAEACCNSFEWQLSAIHPRRMNDVMMYMVMIIRFILLWQECVCYRSLVACRSRMVDVKQ